MPDAGCRMLDTGYWILDTGSISNSRVLYELQVLQVLQALLEEDLLSVHEIHIYKTNVVHAFAEVR